MIKMLFAFCIGFVLITTLHASTTEATICKPMSKFKIDCDVCFCSENGKEYTCQAGICSSYDAKERFDDPDLILTNNEQKLRKPRLTPYYFGDDIKVENKGEEYKNEVIDDTAVDNEAYDTAYDTLYDEQRDYDNLNPL